MAAVPLEPGIDVERVTGTETVVDPPCDVLVHNDDVTPFDFVIIVLAAVFELAWRRAQAVTNDAHWHGVAYVTTLPLEEAKYRVGRAHAAARQAGYPLTFTIEPAS